MNDNTRYAEYVFKCGCKKYISEKNKTEEWIFKCKDCEDDEYLSQINIEYIEKKKLTRDCGCALLCITVSSANARSFIGVKCKNHYK